jgi:hypothetical protein
VPRLIVWCLRAALLNLGAGFSLGAIMLATPVLHLPGDMLRFRLLHAELLLIGWMVQLALGVAYWILPRFRVGFNRGRSAPVWIAMLLLNGGVYAAGIGQAVGMLAMAWAGRVGEGLAALIFATHLWLRVGHAGRGEVRSP